MNIFEFRNSKAGMTLVEMVISLVILGILMTSTMGMIISSNNIFISTTKAALDKQVGNKTFDLFEKMLKYTTSLVIADEPDSAKTQYLCIGNSSKQYAGDSNLESGRIYYQPLNGEPYYFYPDSFYGTGAQKRTVQYSVKKHVNNDGSSDGKHVDLVVKVIREGKVVYNRSAIIRCVNLGLASGAFSNEVDEAKEAPEFNQVISFQYTDLDSDPDSVKEWDVEYKLNEYIARYNAILSEYYGKLDSSNGPVKALNDKYGDIANKVSRASTTMAFVNAANKAIFGTLSTSEDYEKNSIKSDGSLPTDAGRAPSIDGDNYQSWTNLRGYYQKQIYNLLKFSPATITSNEDPFYKVIADKRELYLGFLLTYYDKNKDGKMEQSEYPTLDADKYFKDTVMYKYAAGDKNAAPNDSMVILANLTDVNNDVFYINSQDYYCNTTKREVLVSDSGYADQITGSTIKGNMQFSFKEGNETKSVASIMSTSEVDTSKAYLKGKTTFLTSNYLSTSDTEKKTTIVNDAEVVWKSATPTTKPTTASRCYYTNYTHYWSVEEHNLTMTTHSRSYINYEITEEANNAFSVSAVSTPQEYYVFNYSKYFPKGTITGSTRCSSTNHNDDMKVPITYKVYTNVPMAPIETWTLEDGTVVPLKTDTTYTEEQNNAYNNTWSTAGASLADKLGATNITSMCSANPSTGSSNLSASGISGNVPYVTFNITTDCPEGWYYYKDTSRSAYYFFYLDAYTTDDVDYVDDDNKDQTYVVNKDRIAIAANEGKVRIFPSRGEVNGTKQESFFFSYDQTKYELARSTDKLVNGKTSNFEFKTYDIKEHQYVDSILYSVDWNSWFSQTQTGLLNKVISFIKKIFTGDTSISGVSPSNAQDVLGGKGQYTVGKTDFDARSYNLAWCVYSTDKTSWYYLPMNSNMASTALSKQGFYSDKDGPTMLDTDAWQNSTAMNADINNRKLTSSALLGLVDTTSDVNWTSLPSSGIKSVKEDAKN